MVRLSKELLKRITQIDNLLRLCWFGLLCSLGIYTFIAYKIEHAPTLPHQSILTFILSLTGIIFMVMSLWLRYILISPRAVAKYLDSKKLFFFSSCNSVNRAPSDLDDTEMKMLSYARKAQLFQMILWGMLNSTAVFGLVLSILISQPDIIIAFVIPVFVVTLMQYPNTRSLLEAGLIEKNLER